jgi:hypothetical protein
VWWSAGVGKVADLPVRYREIRFPTFRAVHTAITASLQRVADETLSDCGDVWGSASIRRAG